MESMEKGLKLLMLKLTVCLKVWNIHLKITKMVIQAPVLLKSIILKFCAALIKLVHCLTCIMKYPPFLFWQAKHHDSSYSWMAECVSESIP